MKHLVILVLVAGFTLAAGVVKHLSDSHAEALEACRAANTGVNCDWIVR
jgi:hypothetical protein